MHDIDTLFHLTLKQKKRVMLFVFMPDFNPVMREFLTPMKFIMCLMVAEVKAMCGERL